jgi:1-phosphofructokinase
MKTEHPPLDVVTVTLNPAIDRTVTISNFTVGAVNRADATQDSPGGKGVNVASALADCGLRACVTGFLGRDSAGSFEAFFLSKKIEDRFVRIAGRTRVGIKITDPVSKVTTDINFSGPAPTPEDVEALREKLGALNSAWWVVAGSVPPGLEPGIYREIIAGLKGRGARVVLDTSGEALRQAIYAGPHIVKPNLAELQALLGSQVIGTSAVVKAARKLLDKGIEMVVVSMGKEGACFVTGSEAVIARSPDVEVRSTVGAGDAMVAGIVAAQIRGLPLEECARLASAFALQALSRIESGVAAEDALKDGMKQITVERLSARSK